MRGSSKTSAAGAGTPVTSPVACGVPAALPAGEATDPKDASVGTAAAIEPAAVAFAVAVANAAAAAGC